MKVSFLLASLPDSPQSPRALCEQHLLVQLVDLLCLSTGSGEAEVTLLGLALNDCFGAVVVFGATSDADLTSDLVGRNKLLVLVNNGAAETAFLDDDGGEDESGTNLYQVELGL